VLRFGAIAGLAALAAGCTLDFGLQSLPLGCADGSTACGNTCVDTHSDPANCGSCGAACSAQSLGCAAGRCESLQTLDWMSSSTAASASVTAMAMMSSPTAEQFDYMANGMQVYDSQSFTFSAVAPATRTFRFAWTYMGYHAYFMASAGLQAFATGPNGDVATVDLVAPNTGTSAGFNFSGTSSLSLTAGQTFGFIASGKNFDSDARLIGTITITPN
jgi:hypothetical protein